MAFVRGCGGAHTFRNIEPVEVVVLYAIESFVRLFEGLLFAPLHRHPPPARHADNDNGEASDDERRWAAYR